MTTALAPKTQLGRYQLVRHLASGGMADLWLARVTGAETGIDGFERHVAIKRIRHEQARDARFVQMFLDEARLAASLHHNNIATVHDIGQTRGEYFFAMEYVHGEDLRKILMHASAREQYLPIEHVMTIALSTCAALHYAHEHKAQVVHRDVSPANIIVGYDGTVKVVDFGIAKAAHRTKETQSGVLKGKTAYMSPEQCVGQQVDRRSDIFSLGIVLYELATVRRLFKGANDFLTMSAIIHGEIPPPSLIRPGVPRELEAIIMRALSPEPADRFQTAEEMRAALERFCVANYIRTSQTLLAEYMRGQFGTKPEPWLVDDAPETALTIDFDGTLPGVVKIPEAALRRGALPATTPIQPSAPIMVARTKAITQPPVPTLAAAEERTVSVPPLSVGDETMMVRPLRASRGTHVAAVVIGALACIAAAFFVLHHRDADDGTSEARPEIRMPPPSTAVAPPVVLPAIPDAATADAEDEEYEEVVVDEDDEPKTPGTLVKLREPDGSAPPPEQKKKKIIKRRIRRTPPPPQPTPDAKWNPTTLFPEK